MMNTGNYLLMNQEAIKDVFIDSLGALTGITLIFIIILAIKIILSLFKNLLNREDLSSEEFNN